MSSVVAPADDLPLDPRVLLRGVTATLAVAAALWHLTGALSLPAGAGAALAIAITIAVAHLSWATWLVLRPSRVCLSAGAVASVAMLAASSALLLLVGAGAQTPAALVGIIVQSSLLVLILAGRRPCGPGVLRPAARGGAVVAALLFSLSAAGGVHVHPAATSGKQTSGPPAYLCHLL